MTLLYTSRQYDFRGVLIMKARCRGDDVAGRNQAVLVR
jgi:hypothetical protein